MSSTKEYCTCFEVNVYGCPVHDVQKNEKRDIAVDRQSYMRAILEAVDDDAPLMGITKRKLYTILKKATTLGRETATWSVAAKGLKLTEEVGELAEVALIESGWTLHKTTKEDSYAEAADVILCVFDLLSLLHRDETEEQVLAAVASALERKYNKWEKRQIEAMQNVHPTKDTILELDDANFEHLMGRLLWAVDKEKDCDMETIVKHLRNDRARLKRLTEKQPTKRTKKKPNDRSYKDHQF